jgi:hypothetical protein
VAARRAARSPSPSRAADAMLRCARRSRRCMRGQSVRSSTAACRVPKLGPSPQRLRSEAVFVDEASEDGMADDLSVEVVARLCSGW